MPLTLPPLLKQRRVRTGLVLAAAVLLAWLFWPRQPAQVYVTAKVGRGNLEDTVLATGIIKAYKQVSVGAQVSGQIKKLHVALGQSVKAGDLVAEIDPRTQQNTLLDAEAQLAAYQAQLAGKTATLAKARQDFVRQETMLKDEATSREAFDAARASLDSASADVGQLKAQIEQARIKVSTARLNLGYTTIVAPFDGVVVSMPVDEGQTVNAAQTTPTLIKLAQLDTMTVKAEISEGDVPRIKPGLPVYFTILGAPDTRYRTTLRSIDPGPVALSDDTSTTGNSSSSGSSAGSTAIYYYGLMDVDNPHRQLRIDMTAQVSIVLAEAKNVLTIPSTALGERQPSGDYTVRVLNADGQAETRTVRVGLNNNVRAEVKSGLKEGERVIVGEQDAGAPPSQSGGRRRSPMGF